MSVASADPQLLESFVAGVKSARAGAETERSSLASLQASVAAGCPGRAVDVPALSSLLDALGNMAINERFVATVRDALVAADVYGDGVVTVSSTAIDVALAAAGLSTPPSAVTFDPTTREVMPPTSGMIDDPINAANGNMVHHENDLQLPEIAGALDIVRTWNSLLADRPGAFGAGWSSALDVRLDIEPDHVTAWLADGNVIGLVETSEHAWVAPGVPRVSLESTVDGWRLRTDQARHWVFDADGRLVGWRVGVAEVTVERSDDGVIIRLAEAITGRWVRVVWDESAHVSQLVTEHGWRVRYHRDLAGKLVGATSDAGSVEYVWDDALLRSVVDADGVAAFVNRYDDDGRVVEQTGPFGRVSAYRYDDTGLTVFSDAAGVVQAMRHDRLGNLTEVIDTDGSAMRLAYDEHRRVIRVVERDGATWRYRFSGPELVERIDPDGLSERWDWDDLGRIVTRWGRSGEPTRYEYDTEYPAPSRVIGPDDSIASQVLDERGLPVEITDADGVVTRVRWTRDGQVEATIDAFGAATELSYDAHGLLRRLTPPSGAPTVLTLDPHGRVIRSERAEASWEYRYTSAGRVTGGTEPGGLGWSATFGGHGAATSLTDAAGSSVQFDYDAIGNTTAITAPDGARYRNVFDEVGRHVAAIEPTGATTVKAYDRRGRLREVTDPNGHVWRRRVDVLGRTAASTTPDGRTTAFTYHPDGETAAVITSDGRAWRTEVDRCGRPVARVSPEGRRSELGYTPAGRVRTRTSPDGRTETFDYDAAGHLSAVVGADGVRRELRRDERGFVASVTEIPRDDSDGSRTVDLLWDDEYRLVGVRRDHVELGPVESTVRRDAGGRIVESTDASGVTTRFEWDSRGLLARAVDPTGAATTYHRDVRGHLASIVGPSGGVTEFGFGADGRQESVTDPAGVTQRLVRDPAGRVVGARYADGTGWDLILDENGHEVRRVGTDGSIAADYSYDSAGRLVAASVPDGRFAIDFLWDDDDRLSAVVEPDGVRSVEPAGAPSGVAGLVDDQPTRRDRRDAAGRLSVGRDGTAYRYDAAGRLVEVLPTVGRPTRFSFRPDGLLESEHGPAAIRRFRYDEAGRVIAVDVEGSGPTTIAYDDAGRRRQEDHPDGSRTTYRWDVFDRLIAIERSDVADRPIGRVEVGYDAFDRPRLVDDELVGFDPATGLADRLGDRPLPSVEDRDRPLGGIPIGGLWSLGARVLDPITHQFLTTDPLVAVPGTPGAASGYTYAWYDPINWADPTGLRPLSIEEFRTIREREEQGRLGQAWEAIKDDPWGTLAMVGVTAIGVGLCFVPGGQVIGAGILIGVATSAGIGLATGTFSPTTIAIGGAIGAIPGGSTLRGAVAIGAATGAGETVAGSVLTGQGFPSAQQLLVGTALGGVGGGAGHAAATHLAPIAEHSATTARLQAHTDASIADFDNHVISMSQGQAAAAARYPRLEPAFRGDLIDTATKARVLADPTLDVSVTPRFTNGPDFFDESRGTWWDMTTDRQWPAHVDSYSAGWGDGTHLPTSTGSRPAGGLYVWDGRLTRGAP